MSKCHQGEEVSLLLKIHSSKTLFVDTTRYVSHAFAISTLNWVLILFRSGFEFLVGQCSDHRLPHRKLMMLRWNASLSHIFMPNYCHRFTARKRFVKFRDTIERKWCKKAVDVHLCTERWQTNWRSLLLKSALMAIPWNSLKSFCTKRTVSILIQSNISFSTISRHDLCFLLQFLVLLASIIQCFNSTRFPISSFATFSFLFSFILFFSSFSHLFYNFFKTFSHLFRQKLHFFQNFFNQFNLSSQINKHFFKMY